MRRHSVRAAALGPPAPTCKSAFAPCRRLTASAPVSRRLHPRVCVGVYCVHCERGCQPSAACGAGPRRGRAWHDPCPPNARTLAVRARHGALLGQIPPICCFAGAAAGTARGPGGTAGPSPAPGTAAAAAATAPGSRSCTHPRTRTCTAQLAAVPAGAPRRRHGVGQSAPGPVAAGGRGCACPSGADSGCCTHGPAANAWACCNERHCRAKRSDGAETAFTVAE